MHALFVDDEVEFLQLMEKRLSRRGMTIVTAPDGQSALDIVTEAMKQPETMFQVVVMDVRDGGIVALSSYPTFSPETFTGAISQDTWDLFNTDESYHPMLNRAVSGTYPAASTYKAFTGLAALAYGFADTKRTWDCGGSWDGFDTGQPQMCWKLWALRSQFHRKKARNFWKKSGFVSCLPRITTLQ